MYKQFLWLRYCLAVVLAGFFAGITPMPREALAGRTANVLRFEQSADGVPVNLPGVQLTTDTGQPWIYGDARTHKYNAPYPASCMDRPAGLAHPVCDYAVGGNVFIWTGFIGKEGRITFTQRQATYFQADVSTGADLTFIAYDMDGVPLVGGFLGANQGTGNLDTMRLNAPVGKLIASIRILGAANFWLLDNLQSDAIRIPRKAAEIAVSQRAELRDGWLHYTIVVSNHGKGTARQVRMHVPFDPAVLQLRDASFSRGGAWVSRILSTTIELETGRLGSQQDVITATLRFQPLHTTIALSDQPLIYTWSGDNGSTGSGQANRAQFAGADGMYALAMVLVHGSDSIGYRFSSSLFVPNEPIAFWYNKPDGSVVPLGTVRATAAGLAEIELATSQLPPGFYSMIAYGTWSKIQGIGRFLIS